MIEYRKGDLLKADVEALVNTVNCVGVMGKGIALQFKQKFPDNFRQYKRVCDRGDLEPGTLFVHDRGELFGDSGGPRYIINFPTKTHWKKPSKLEYIASGMDALIDEMQARGVESIALPPLGCGNGGLDWSEVRAIIESHAKRVPDVHFVLFPPGYEPDVEDIEIGTDRPSMTRGRALVIKLLDLYQETGYEHGRLEAQKLAYFLQEAGEDLRLNYVAKHYGPFANNLNHVLQRIEGHFIRGYGDRDQESAIQLLDGAVQEAENEIDDHPEAQRHLEQVADLIEGFETPFGLELLSSVLWVARESPKAQGLHEAIQRVHDWNRRKKDLFTPQQIEVAWNRLGEEGWLERAEPVPA